MGGEGKNLKKIYKKKTSIYHPLNLTSYLPRLSCSVCQVQVWERDRFIITSNYRF